MKKFLATAIVLSLAISMAACGIGKKSESTSVDESFTAGSKLSTDKLSADNSKESNSDNTDTDGSGEGEGTATAPTEQLDASNFKEITVIDNDKCSIKLTSMKPDYDGTYMFDVSIENKSDGVKYLFYALDAVVNGVACTPMMGEYAEPGETKSSELRFSNLDLPDDRQGTLNTKIDFSDIRITFRVQDADNSLSELILNETVRIYPFGEDKANIYVRHSQMTDRVIMANNDVTVSIIGYAYNTDWSYAADLYVQNHTDKNIILSVSDCYINGVPLDPYFALTALSNSSVFNSIEWNVESLKELGIDKINTIEMKLSTYDESYNAVLQSEDIYIDASSIDFKARTETY